MLNKNSIISDKQASDVYDRQIRLWGADAQAKMAQSRVLYLHVTGVSSEILKNLVLAGIRAAICDPRSLDQVATTPSLFFSGFQKETNATKKPKYASVMEALKPSVEELNPLLGECEMITDWKTAVKDFPIVVASAVSISDMLYLAKYSSAKLFVVDTFGLYGAAILDLREGLLYRPEKGKELLETKSLEPYVPLETILATPLSKAVNRFHKQVPPEAYWRYRCLLEYRERTGIWLTGDATDVDTVLEPYLQETAGPDLRQKIQETSSLNKTAEMAPVCAVLGGLIGNEVIKVISGKGTPANNTILMDGLTCKAMTFLVKAKE